MLYDGTDSEIHLGVVAVVDAVVLVGDDLLADAGVDHREPSVALDDREVEPDDQPILPVLRSDAGHPFYAGKGKDRRIAYHIKDAQRYGTTTRKRAIIMGHPNEGLEISYEIDGWHDTSDDAYAREAELVKQYGRLDLGTGCLANMDNGGAGIVGHGPETREKMRQAKLGRKLTEDHRRKVGDAQRGRKRPPETGQKIRERITGQTRSNEVREKQSLAKKGKPLSAEHRKKISEGHKRKWVTPGRKRTRQ